MNRSCDLTRQRQTFFGDLKVSLRALNLDVGNFYIMEQVLTGNIAERADAVPLAHGKLRSRLTIPPPLKGLIECERRFRAVDALIQARAESVLEHEIDRGVYAAIRLTNASVCGLKGSLAGPEDRRLAQRSRKCVIEANHWAVGSSLPVRYLPRCETSCARSPKKGCIVMR